MNDIFTKANTPEVLRDFILGDLQLEAIADLIGYVAQGSYETEWRDIIVGAFPVRVAVEAQAAVPAAEGVPARPQIPATPGFLDRDQRLLISRMRTTHRMALDVEKEDAEDRATAKKDQYEADMEKPLDPETKLRLKRQWKGSHNWEPVASMRAAPKLRNRVVREFGGLCMTNHTVENV